MTSAGPAGRLARSAKRSVRQLRNPGPVEIQSGPPTHLQKFFRVSNSKLASQDLTVELIQASTCVQHCKRHALKIMKTEISSFFCTSQKNKVTYK